MLDLRLDREVDLCSQNRLGLGKSCEGELFVLPRTELFGSETERDTGLYHLKTCLTKTSFARVQITRLTSCSHSPSSPPLTFCGSALDVFRV